MSRLSKFETNLNRASVDLVRSLFAKRGQMWLVSFAGITLICSALVGCGKFSPSQPGVALHKDGSAHATDPEDAYIESQNMTDDAEDLVEPDSLDRANDKFIKALEIDPTNFRAKFYIEALKPVFAAQGYLARIRPFYLALPDGANRYATMVDRALSGNEARYRQFMLNGPEDIHTVAEMQEYFDTIILSLENLRQFLKSNKSQELRLRRIPKIFPGVGGEEKESSIAECTNSKFGPLTVDLGYCGTNREISLNRADFEVLQLSVASYEGYLALFNAYTVNPKLVEFAYDKGEQADNEAQKDSNVDSYSPEDRAQRVKLTQQYLTLISDSGFGHLRKSNQFSMYEDFAQGIKIAIFYYLDNQATLCKEGFFTKRNRPGYLIDEGFCRNPFRNENTGEESTVRVAKAIERGLLGKTITPEVMKQQTDRPWGVNALALLRKPPENLSFLKAPEPSGCRFQAVDVDDSKLAAYMTNGTATDVLDSTNSLCWKSAK